jgi:hypothetical protein
MTSQWDPFELLLHIFRCRPTAQAEKGFVTLNALLLIG